MRLLLLTIAFLSLIKFDANSQTIPIKNDPSVGEKENLAVFQQWSKWSSPGSIPVNTFIRIASEAYTARDNQIAEINSLDQWKERQKYIKTTLHKIFEQSFVSGPLNAKTTGVIKKKGYRIEKILFESVPGYYVTGCIYVPEKTKGRMPAVLNLMGHDQEAFRAELYQLINVNLALKGMVVFTMDPPGQGEMVQYFDSAKKASSIGYSVIEHCYFANQCFLSGVSPAVHFVRDGMRAIDYLISRKDVDPNNIGVTGFSGGGTITSYLSAVDERVKVSIPSSWSTASRRQLETKGAQDGESVLLNSLTQGITFEDLLEVRAPRPTMMTFVSRDQYLSVQGAREYFNEAKKIYSAYGNENDLQLVEDNSRHWLTPKIRRALYTFFTQKFNIKVDSTETPIEFLPADNLRITPTGQVSSAYGSKLVFDLNKEHATKLVEEITTSRKNNSNHITEITQKAKSLSGYDRYTSSEYAVFFNGRYHRDNYSISKMAIERKDKSPIPFLLFIPDDTSKPRPAIIYLNPAGKDADAASGGEIERLINKGYIVAAVDVFANGEVANNVLRPLCVGYASVLTGQSATGIQADEVNTVAKFLKSSALTSQQQIGGIAMKQLCFPLLHAAAFEKLFDNIVLVDCPLSYSSLAMNRKYKINDKPHDEDSGVDPAENDFTWGVAGALTAYDLVDLAAAFSPAKMAFSRPRDHLFQPASKPLIEKELEYAISIYKVKNIADRFRISERENLHETIDWAFK